jgi:hypothetical protein
MRKPFDMLAEGLFWKNSRGGEIRTRDLLHPKQQAPVSNPLQDNGLTETPSGACTAACTSEPENANAGTPETHQDDKGEGTAGDPLVALAAAIAGLSPGDRERLAAMLDQGGKQGDGSFRGGGSRNVSHRPGATR